MPLSFLILFLCCELQQLVINTNLNTPTVLLPWSSNSCGFVTFELRADPSDVCLHWSIQKSGLVGVSKNGGSCSNSIRIRPITLTSDRQSSIILAKDSDGNILRSDVIVDKIDKIEIVTRTRELGVGEMFETIGIIAHDKENNIFNSLVGLKFEWSIEPSPNSAIKDINSILKITNFEKTSYHTDPAILDLETRGYRGSSIMIEPINTGEVVLTVKYRDPSYDKLLKHSVTILVRDEIFLEEDNELYVLINTLTSLNARRFLHRRYYSIHLPSSQYSVKISDKTVLDFENGKVRSKNYGTADVSIIDTYIPKGKHINIPSVIFKVVVPTHIIVFPLHCEKNINEQSCFYLKSNHSYDFSLQIFHQDHLIRLDSRIKLITKVLSESINVANVAEISSNGSLFNLKTKEKGDVNIIVKILGYINDKNVKTYFDKELTLHKLIHVVDPIKINPVNTIYLVEMPRPLNKPMIFDFKTSGGTENHVWKLKNELESYKLIKIIKEGKIEVLPRVGTYEIVVFDSIAKSPLLNDLLTIIVLPLDHIKFATPFAESFVNQTSTVPVDLFVRFQESSEHFKVYDYPPLPFEYSASHPEKIVFVDAGSGIKLSKDVKFLSSAMGVNQISVKLNLVDVPGLTDSFHVSSYNHLKLIKNCKLINGMPGSELHIVVEGGPNNFIQGNKFYAKLDLLGDTSSEQNIFDNTLPIIAEKKFLNDSIMFSLKCKKVGSVYANVVVGHDSSIFSNPIVESITIGPLICADPSDYDIINVVKNIESKQECDLIYHKYDSEILALNATLLYKNENVPICHNPLLTPRLISRNNDIENIANYEFRIIRSDMVDVYHVFNSDLVVGNFELDFILDYSFKTYKKTFSKAISVNFIKYPHYNVKSVSLLNHPDYFVTLPISGGSSQLDVYFYKQGLLSSTFSTSAKSGSQNGSPYHDHGSFKALKITPNMLGSTKSVLLDLCLSTLPLSDLVPWSLSVNVVTIDKISAKYQSKIIMESKSRVDVFIFDNLNSLVNLTLFHQINVDYKLSTDAFLEIEKPSFFHTINSSAYFFVTPKSVGSTTIIITASYFDKSMRSVRSLQTTITIESYDPLRVYPTVIYAVPHMTFQLELRGGPSTSSEHTIQYVFNSDYNVVDVSNYLHLIYTKGVGDVYITINSVCASTGQILSQSGVWVHSWNLQQVKIISHSSVLVANSTAFVGAQIINEKNQIVSFGLLPPSITYYWSVSEPNFVVSSYGKTGYDQNDDGSENIGVKFVELGRSMLQLKIVIKDDYLNYISVSNAFLHKFTYQSSVVHYLFEKADFTIVPSLSLSAVVKSSDSRSHHAFDSHFDFENDFRIKSDEILLNPDAGSVLIKDILNDGAKSELGFSLIKSEPSNVISLVCDIEVGSKNDQSVKNEHISCNKNQLFIIPNSIGTAVVMVFQRYQSRSFVVSVKKVSQIFCVLTSDLKTLSKYENPYRWFSFPQGYYARFKLVALDKHGLVFHSRSFKDFRIHCVICHKVQIENYLSEYGGFVVNMKKTGKVSLKVVHVENPEIYFNLQFSIIHGLATEVISGIDTDSTFTKMENDDPVTVVEEVTIHRPLGTLFFLAPLFSTEHDKMKWYLPSQDKVEMVWQNGSHALFYAKNLGDTKLSVFTDDLKQLIGNAVIQIEAPKSLSFANSDKLHITNCAMVESCAYFSVDSYADSVNVVIDDYKIKDGPFSCHFSTENKTDRLFRYMTESFDLYSKIDSSGTSCCLRFANNPKVTVPPKLMNEISTFELIVKISNNPDLDIKKDVVFMHSIRFENHENNEEINSCNNHNILDEDKLPVLWMPENSATKFFKLYSSPDHLPFIKVNVTESDCFNLKLTPDNYNNKALILKISTVSQECEAYDVKFGKLTIESTLTKQTLKFRLNIEQGNIVRFSSGSQFVGSIMRSLPTGITVDLKTLLFTLLSILGTFLLLFYLSEKVPSNSNKDLYVSRISKISQNISSLRCRNRFAENSCSSYRSNPSSGIGYKNIMPNHDMLQSNQRLPTTKTTDINVMNDALYEDDVRSPSNIMNAFM